MAEKTQKIGIFDSGLGGTTVLKEMIKSLPNEDYIYYGDNGNFPYGSGKTKNELQKLTERILDFFVKNNCKLVIVACNTASTAAIDYLREKFSLPIIGIVEAGVKIASKNTKNKRRFNMGVIAWLVLGALSGWIANRLMNSRTGLIDNIIIGIIGAFIGGFVFNFLGAQTITGLNLHSIFVSVVGACILLWIINKIRR